MKIDFDNLDRHDCHQLLVGMVTPRPIAWVSTVAEDGTLNLAPFSFFGGLGSKPPFIYISIGSRRGEKKDTLINIEYAGDFVVNVVDESLAEKMNQTSANYPASVSEFTEVGLTALPSDKVKSPRLAESPISMECKLNRILEFGDSIDVNMVAIGEIVRVHVRDDVLSNGVVDPSKLKAIARLGADFYCRTGDLFEMKRPTHP